MSHKEIMFKGWLVKSPPFQPSKGSKPPSIFRRPERLQPRWRRRYFVLSKVYTSPIRYRLAYFEDDLQTKLKGEVNLDDASNITTHVIPPAYLLNKLPPKLLRAPAEQTPFFLLETIHRRHQRTYYFMPESQTQMERWVNCLSEACNLGEDEFSLDMAPPADFSDTANSSFPPMQGNGFLTVQQNPQRQLLMMQQQQLHAPARFPVQGGFFDSGSLRHSPGRPQLNSPGWQQPSSPAAHQDNEYRVPPPGNRSNYTEDEYRVPPPGNRSIYTEDEYRVPPPVNRSNYTEDEYRLPPPARNRDSDEDDYRLPPPVGGNRELSQDEDDYRLPPASQQQQQEQENATADPDASQYINLSSTSTRVSVDRIQFFNNNNNNNINNNSKSGNNDSYQSSSSGGAARAVPQPQQSLQPPPPVPTRTSAGGDPNSSGGVDYMNVKKLSPLSRVYSLRRTQSPSPSRAPPPPPGEDAVDEPEPLLLPRRRSERDASGSRVKPTAADAAALAASESSSLVESDDDSSSDDNNDEIDGGAVDDSEVTGATVGLPQVIDYAQIDISGLHVAALDSGRSDKVADLTNKMNGQVQYLEVDVRRTAALAEMSVKPTL
ncbi:hypothetical protein BOX15_Mlig024202g1 [Macrostomum lignano]|uniref:PH domain-containing protein n=1 Tax=Macrostomum lignano TaxID=282301 RepID=A0A267GIS7_9PLAT|nr:hypothetical protein BOX15_Mlig024202g1 [Macrostomum lignano]